MASLPSRFKHSTVLTTMSPIHTSPSQYLIEPTITCFGVLNSMVIEDIVSLVKRLAAEDGKTFSDINHEEKYVSSEMLAKTDEEGQHKRINDIYPHRKNANDGLTLPGHNLLPGSRSNNLQGSRPRDGLRRGTIPLCGTSKNDCLRKIYGQFRQ
ncbi:hypothetical protein ACF0H5_009452 [Mactra antiquata]